MNFRKYILRKYNSLKIYRDLYKDNPSYTLSILRKKLSKAFYAIFLIPFLPFLLPIVFMVRLLGPFFTLRIGNLESEGIGHFSLPVEIYLNELDCGIYRNKKAIDLWYLDEEICNVALLNKWREHLIILPRNILRPFHVVNKIIPGGAKNEIPFRRLSGPGYAEAKNLNPWQSVDIYDVISKTKPRIKFTEEEIKGCKNILKKIGFDPSKKFVCVSVRDSSYHNDSSLSSHRNSSINDYVDAFHYLDSLGYEIVRMGAKVSETLDDGLPIFDYANSGIRSDLLDLFLISRCSFYIGTGSGLDMVCSLFRKMSVLLNFSQLGTLPEVSHNSLVLFRRMKINDRMLSLEEIISNGYERFTRGSDFASAGITLVNNSDTEIRSILFEAHQKLSGTWSSLGEESDQEVFRSFFKAVGHPNHLRATIDAEFIKTII